MSDNTRQSLRPDAASHAFSHGLPEDPDMPGFPAALDPDAMAGLFQTHWLGDHARCSAVNVVRFRYRPRRRLIVVYEVDVSTPAHPEPKRLTVTGRIHPQRELRTRKARPVFGTGDLLPETALLPGLSMAIEVFPRDRRMPALRDLSDPRSLATMTLFNRAAALPPLNRQPLASRLMRYRPGLSATLKISAAAGASGAPAHYFVKVTSDDEIAHEVEAAGRVNDELAKARHNGLRLAEPVAWLKQDNIAVYRPAPGIPLDHMIITGQASPREATRVGEALADLHGLDVPGLRRSQEEVLAPKIARARNLISWARPGLCAKVEAISKDAERLFAIPVVGPTHRDMKPEHIFVDQPGKCVHLIDSGSMCMANPVIDIGALIVRLNYLAHTHALAPAPAKAFADAILAAYFARVPPAWRACLGPATSYATLLLALHAIQGLKPNWPETLNRIVTDAFHNIDAARAYI